MSAVAAGVIALAVALAGCASVRLGEPLGDLADVAPVPPLVEVWERDAGAAFGPSGALVTESCVVVGTRNGEVVVLDGATGRIRGEAEVGQSVEGALAVSDGGRVVFIPTAEAGGGIRALDVQTGATLWRWKGGAVEGGVVRVGGVVVTATRAGLVAGLDAETGEQRWGREGAQGAQILAAPSVIGSLVVVVDDGGGVTGFDAATGAERWVARLGEPVEVGVDVSEGLLVVSTVRGLIVRLDPETGTEVWRVRTERPVRLTTAASRSGAVALGGTDGVVRVLDAATGTERWRWRSDANVSARPVWLEGHLAVGTQDERLVLLHAETGAEVWSTELKGRVKSALVVGSERLIVLSEPRHVVAFEGAR